MNEQNKNKDTSNVKDINKEVNNQEIIELANTLADRIRNSKEYLSYCEARRKLYVDKQNSQKLAEYRKQQLRLHIAQISGEDTDEDLAELEKAYFSFCGDEVVSDFLYAEGRFSRLLNDVQSALGKNLDIWMELGIDEDESGGLLN